MNLSLASKPPPNVLRFRQSPASGQPTFRQLAEEWLRTEGARLVAPDNERRHVDHLFPLWEFTEETLRPRLVKQVLGNLLRPSGPLGPTTVNKVLGTGRRIIREAQLNDLWMGQNPFEVVRRLRQTRPVHRVLSLAEARAVLPHLAPGRRREVLVMLYLGLRPGEWKALRRIDVDLLGGFITIRRSNGRDATKTGRERVVPIPHGLRPVLEEAIVASPTELVFPSPTGKRQHESLKLSRTLRAAMRKAGLVSGYDYVCRRRGCGNREYLQVLEPRRCPACGMKLWATGVVPPIRFYDLRHTAATLLRMAGTDPLVIQLALGHAAENLTDSIYTHLSPDYVRAELNKLRI